MSAEEAKSHFRSILGKFNVMLYGKTLQFKSDDDVFDLWRFFYNSHVVNARISDSTQRDGYRHERPERASMLVTKARWNDLQAMFWEINTAFRDYLVTKRAENEARTGLPYRKKPRRKK